MTDRTNPTPGPRLVLFDIDGTLMITKGMSSRCMKRAGEIVFGPTFQFHPITAGTLDPQIFAKLAADNGIHATPEQHIQYEETYLAALEQELIEKRQDITLMPGIEPLIEHLHQRALSVGDVILGVLTGNFRRATELKLTHAGLGLDRFTVIVCAEDGEHRDELPRVALQRAALHAGQPIATTNTFIIGDTPRDIQCAKANDCQCICVATGRYSAQQLREAGGSVVYQSLEDYGPALDVLSLR